MMLEILRILVGGALYAGSVWAWFWGGPLLLCALAGACG